MSVYVRRLRESDLPKVLVVYKWLHENSRYSVFNWNEAKVKTLLSMSLDPSSDVYASVALEKGSSEILGFVHGFVDEHYFSDQKYAGDYRRKAPKLLRLMIQQFEKWAKNNGAVEVSIGASTEAYGTGYKKFLKRQGYRDVGFLAVKG
jgi:hypothetical protein